MNRFGKTQTIYAGNLNELRKRVREEQDEKALNSDLLTKMLLSN